MRASTLPGDFGLCGLEVALAAVPEGERHRDAEQRHTGPAIEIEALAASMVARATRESGRVARALPASCSRVPCTGSIPRER
jgi:hypothetical protein